MNASILALIGFVGLTMALALSPSAIGSRKSQTGKPADSWTRGKPTNDPDVIQRISHAHLNCVENLPLFGGVVLAAVGLNQLAIVDRWRDGFLAAASRSPSFTSSR